MLDVTEVVGLEEATGAEAAATKLGLLVVDVGVARLEGDDDRRNKFGAWLEVAIDDELEEELEYCVDNCC